jgi:hypothetical protein
MKIIHCVVDHQPFNASESSARKVLYARRFYERHVFKAVQFSDGQSNEEKCPDVLYERARQSA